MALLYFIKTIENGKVLLRDSNNKQYTATVDDTVTLPSKIEQVAVKHKNGHLNVTSVIRGGA